MEAKILIVDDDARLRELLCRYLGQQGMRTDTLEDTSALSRKLAHNRPDLIVLDVMLPGEDGLAALRRIRGQGETVPVILLTARGEEIDRILGLEMGADDYLAKPFNPRELLARIQAVLRRHHSTPLPRAAHPADARIQFAGFELNLARRELLGPDGPVQLTSAEFAILALLGRHPGQPFSREQLIEQALGRPGAALERSVDVHVSRLRKALGQQGNAPLQTVWGVGYMLVPDAPPEDDAPTA